MSSRETRFHMCVYIFSCQCIRFNTAIHLLWLMDSCSIGHRTRSYRWCYIAARYGSFVTPNKWHILVISRIIFFVSTCIMCFSLSKAVIRWNFIFLTWINTILFCWISVKNINSKNYATTFLFRKKWEILFEKIVI